MARRRRGLGSSPADHSARATAHAQDTRASAKELARLSAKGQCKTALTELSRMNRQWGATIHEYKGAGWKRKFPHKIADQVEGAEKVFELNCVASAARVRPAGPPKLQLVHGARRRR